MFQQNQAVMENIRDRSFAVDDCRAILVESAK
jgi:hypothetical protein